MYKFGILILISDLLTNTANKFKGKFEIQIIFDILSASKSITFPS